MNLLHKKAKVKAKVDVHRSRISSVVKTTSIERCYHYHRLSFSRDLKKALTRFPATDTNSFFKMTTLLISFDSTVMIMYIKQGCTLQNWVEGLSDESFYPWESPKKI